jgi:hypothetical protein
MLNLTQCEKLNYFDHHATRPSMRNDTDSIDQKRRRLAAIEKGQLVELVAELWVSVEALMQGTAKSSRSITGSKGRSEIGIKLTKAWAAILRRLSTYKHFRAADVILVSRDFQQHGNIGRIQTPGSARAQLCQLTRKGIIKRLGGGNYRVTEQTKAALEHLRR